MVVDTFNPSTQEAGESLTSRPAWSMEQAAELPNLGNEGKQGKQKLLKM